MVNAFFVSFYKTGRGNEIFHSQPEPPPEFPKKPGTAIATIIPTITTITRSSIKAKPCDDRFIVFKYSKSSFIFFSPHIVLELLKVTLQGDLLLFTPSPPKLVGGEGVKSG